MISMLHCVYFRVFSLPAVLILTFVESINSLIICILNRYFLHIVFIEVYSNVSIKIGNIIYITLYIAEIIRIC